LAAGLDEIHIGRLHAVLPQSLNDKVLGVSPEPSYTQFLAFEILGPFDFGLGHNTVGQGVLGAGDEDEFSHPLRQNAYDRFAAGDGYLAIAAEHCGGHHCTGGDINELKVQIISPKQANLLSNPRHRLRHRTSRVNPDQLFRGQSRVRQKLQSKKNNGRATPIHHKANLHQETLLNRRDKGDRLLFRDRLTPRMLQAVCAEDSQMRTLTQFRVSRRVRPDRPPKSRLACKAFRFLFDA
jgi:hypothetical protein